MDQFIAFANENLLVLIASALGVFFLIAAFVKGVKNRHHRQLRESAEAAAANGGTADAPVHLGDPFAAVPPPSPAPPAANAAPHPADSSAPPASQPAEPPAPARAPAPKPSPQPADGAGHPGEPPATPATAAPAGQEKVPPPRINTDGNNHKRDLYVWE